jgi:hypothetical protein
MGEVQLITHLSISPFCFRLVSLRPHPDAAYKQATHRDPIA